MFLVTAFGVPLVGLKALHGGLRLPVIVLTIMRQFWLRQVLETSCKVSLVPFFMKYGAGFVLTRPRDGKGVTEDCALFCRIRVLKFDVR